jgi:hypothetical protein
MGRDHRIVLVVLVVAALLAGFWFAILGPKRAEAERLGAQLDSEQQRLRTAQANASQARTARDRYYADYAAIARLGKAVPGEDDVPSLVYQIESAARDARVDFRSITSAGAGSAPATTPSPSAGTGTAGESKSGGSAGSPSPPATAPGAQGAAGSSTGGLTTLPFSFTFSGSFFDLHRLLGRIDRFVATRGGDVHVRGRLLSIDSIALKPGSDGLSKIQADISATAFTAPAATIDDEPQPQGAAPGGNAPKPSSQASAGLPPTAPATVTGVTP